MSEAQIRQYRERLEASAREAAASGDRDGWRYDIAAINALDTVLGDETPAARERIPFPSD